MKNIEWLKEEVNDYLDIEGVEDARMALKAVLDYIDQLDEPEVTLDKAFEKVAESYPMTKEEIWRHLERLGAHGGKVTYGEPEALSQEWIDNHTASAYTIAHYSEEDVRVIMVSDLQNLLVPKQEEVDQAYKDGYEKGQQHTFYKGYLEGLGDKGNEPETVADVVTDFYKSLERLKEVLRTEVEELEE